MKKFIWKQFFGTYIVLLFKVSKTLFLLLFCGIYVWRCTHSCYIQHVEVRTGIGNQLSPSLSGFWGPNSGCWICMVGTFTHWAIEPAQFCHLLRMKVRPVRRLSKSINCRVSQPEFEAQISPCGRNSVLCPLYTHAVARVHPIYAQNRRTNIL